MTRHSSIRRRLAAALATAAVLAACASVPLKQKATLGIQAAHAAVGAAQDAERALYATRGAGITPQVHGAFGAFFERYFTAEERVAVALLAWRAADPVPPDVATAIAALDEALVAADALTAGAARDSLVGRIAAGIAEVRKVRAALGGAR